MLRPLYDFAKDNNLRRCRDVAKWILARDAEAKLALII